MDYKEKYEMALEGIQEILGSGEDSIKMSRLQLRLQGIFPELKESEDERIRKEIIDFATKANNGVTSILANNYDFNKWIAFLEKQGEQKVPVVDFKAEDWYVSKVDDKIRNIYNSVDKVEPKFHEGEWVSGYYTNYKVLSVNNDGYVVEDVDGNKINILFENEKFHHLFTIADAKDGDVLASNRSIFIFSQEYIAGKPEAYCGIMNDLFIAKPEGCWTNEECYPATKEQRDLLFQKMEEAGYTWNADKKELKKIEQKPWSEEDKNFIYDTLSNLTELKDRYVAGYGNVGKCIDWLKSRRPQNTWKPSDEQMNALDAVLVYNPPCSNECRNHLITLYNELKKLREDFHRHP